MEASPDLESRLPPENVVTVSAHAQFYFAARCPRSQAHLKGHCQKSLGHIFLDLTRDLLFDPNKRLPLSPQSLFTSMESNFPERLYGMRLRNQYSRN